MAIKHAFVSAKPDPADTTIARPSDWNADHTVEDGSFTIGAVTGLTDALDGKAAVAHEGAVTGIHGIVAKGPNLQGVGLGIQAANAATVNTITAVGYAAGRYNTTGLITAVGYTAGFANTTGAITAVGHAAGYSNTTGNTTAVGHSAGRYNTTGLITAVGYAAGFANTTGAITAVGYTAGYSNTTGLITAVGHTAGFANTTGTITAIGYEAGRYNTTGLITAVGHAAGRFLADGTTGNETAANGSYFGSSTRASVAGAANETVIGYAAIGGGSNTVRLGNASVTHWLPGGTNVAALGSTTLGFKELYLHDGTDEWKVAINTSGTLVTTKV